MAHAVTALGAPQDRRTVLLTFATVSWQKGSAAQVVSFVEALRRVRKDLRFRLLSHCPELDEPPARDLGIEIVDPGLSPRAGRDRCSASILWKRLRCAASAGRRRQRPSRRTVFRNAVADAYDAADFVLDLSGDSYRDPPGGFALAHHANFLAALATRTPYGLVSQSIGPFLPVNRPLARYFLDRAALVSVREKRTRAILVRLGLRPDRIDLTPDVAFSLPAGSVDAVWNEEGMDPDRLERPWVALSLSQLARRLASQSGQNSYLEEMARLARHVHERYAASVLLIPHEIGPPSRGPDDRSAAEALCERTNRPPWMHAIRGDHSPSRLKAVIAKCDALVASRMHAAIAGLSSGVPSLLVSWSHKYGGVMQEIGLDDCVWDQSSTASPPLCGLFDQLWKRRETVRARLLGYTARAQEEIAALAERVADRIPRSAFGSMSDLPIPSMGTG